MEARVGIEPTHKAFAEPCLTTWLPRHLLRTEGNSPEFARKLQNLRTGLEASTHNR